METTINTTHYAVGTVPRITGNVLARTPDDKLTILAGEQKVQVNILTDKGLEAVQFTAKDLVEAALKVING